MQRIAAFLGITAGDFVRRFTDCRWQGKEKLLLHVNGRCAFLKFDSSGKISRCLIHQVRPAACRDWVPGPDKSECQEGLSKNWGLAYGNLGEAEGSKEQMSEFQSFMHSNTDDAT
jgi:Fe-S-cluster containining protein